MITSAAKSGLIELLPAKQSTKFSLKPDYPVGRRSCEGRSPAIKKIREADKTLMLPHLRGNLLIIWIPAFAGMTPFFLMDNPG